MSAGPSRRYVMPPGARGPPSSSLGGPQFAWGNYAAVAAVELTTWRFGLYW